MDKPRIPRFTAEESAYVIRNRYSGAGNYAALGTGAVLPVISFGSLSGGLPQPVPTPWTGRICLTQTGISDGVPYIYSICCDESGCDIYHRLVGSIF
jgi:hypothetical protein